MMGYEPYCFEKLYDSAGKCIKGVSHKAEAARFELNRIECVSKLVKKYEEVGYIPGKTRLVKLFYPKRRDAVANRYADRVTQRSINDNALYPQMTKSFVYTNMACQKGKGTDSAILYFKSCLQKYATKYKNKFYIAMTDYTGYYKNLVHDDVNQMLRRCLDSDTAAETIKVLEEQYSGDFGYNPGSQMVQIVGISYPSRRDHFVKEVLHEKEYIRYMDDSVIFDSNRANLERKLNAVRLKDEKMHLNLHPRKTRIYDMSRERIRFLGFDFRVTSSGKILMVVSKDNVKHEKKKLAKMIRMVKSGEISLEQYKTSYSTWRSHASRCGAKTYKLFNMMDRFTKSEWRKVYGSKTQ